MFNEGRLKVVGIMQKYVFVWRMNMQLVFNSCLPVEISFVNKRNIMAAGLLLPIRIDYRTNKLSYLNAK